MDAVFYPIKFAPGQVVFDAVEHSNLSQSFCVTAEPCGSETREVV